MISPELARIYLAVIALLLLGMIISQVYLFSTSERRRITQVAVTAFATASFVHVVYLLISSFNV